jgi:hypothetical protein
MRKEEIEPADFAGYMSELQDALEAICKSLPFSTSPKSCEFLRHIVLHTLRGEADELKERLIGIALLGRKTTYDTGSDAGVRVRANDVRKRLNAYNAAAGSGMLFTLDLPAGSYIPRFFRFAPVSDLSQEPGEKPDSELPGLDPLPPISLQALAIPTLVALFLCTVFMRWQLAQEHPFTAFWQSALETHRALLYLPPTGTDGGRELISMNRMEASAPLLSLAGQFHTRFTLTRSPAPSASSDDIFVTMEPASVEAEEPGSTSAPAAPALPTDRLVIENTPGGRQIVDRGGQNQRLTIPGRAALLTITNGARRSIQIDGTDDAAVSSMVARLCERDSFPQDLTDSFEAGTITQAVFPMTAQADVIVLHEPMPKAAPGATRSQ